MPYRPDIDGLRALAVIGVILFHADLGLDGGFVGVDVFFCDIRISYYEPYFKRPQI